MGTTPRLLEPATLGAVALASLQNVRVPQERERDLSVGNGPPEEGGPEFPMRPRQSRAWNVRLRQALKNRRDFAQECEAEWRDFSQQPGTRLWWVRAGATQRELRTADRQTVASLRYGRPTTVRAGGRTYTRKRVPRSSRPRIAEIVGHSRPRSENVWAKINRRPALTNLRELCDETGLPVLYTSGNHVDRSAGARITFPDRRSLTFPVRGTRRTNAIMTAVDQNGNKIARYRLTVIRPLADKAEIIVHPGQPLTDELVLALAISAGWLSSYFQSSGGGG